MMKVISFRSSGNLSLSRRITVVLFVVVLLLLSAQPAFAQRDGPAGAPASSNPQTELQLLRELIDEVRKLRSALLVNSVLQHRSSLLLERARRQSDLIVRLEGELQDLRQDMRELSDKGRYDEQLANLKEVETELSQAGDPTERADLTLEYGRISRSLERQKKADQEELDRKRERAPKLEARLLMEQATLNDLDSQLEALERDADLQYVETLKNVGPRQ
jgi:small-conductance mechanosensitive channel